MELFGDIHIETIINSIVALATVATLIVIWLTLREMKIERSISYQPIIIASNFKIYSFCKYTNEVPRVFCSTNKEKALNSDASILNILLRNIGQGLAKNISVKLIADINYEEYFQTIQKDFKTFGIDLDMEINQNSCWIQPDEKYGKFIAGNHPYQINFKEIYDYLIPINQQEDEEIIIRLPRSFQLALILTIILLESAETEKLEQYYNRFEEYFELNIKVRYEDNLNNFFEDKFIYVLSKPKIEMKSIWMGKLYTFSLERSTL
ncbi:MAG: hypothetical protein WEA56_06070 [Balneolaceae bacterium]